jgi:hypothetical protein
LASLCSGRKYYTFFWNVFLYSFNTSLKNNRFSRRQNTLCGHQNKKAEPFQTLPNPGFLKCRYLLR